MKRVLLLLGLIAAAGLHAQEPGLLEVRVWGGTGQEECRTVWADEAGVLLAGETSSTTFLNPSQPEDPGPVGQKGFLMALDTALDLQWSFAFQGAPLAPPGTPSALAIRDVVRDPADSLTAWVLFDAPREGKWEGHLMGVHAEEGVVAEYHLTAPGAAFTAALTPAGGSTFLVVGHTVPTAAPGLPAGIQVGLWTGDMDTPPGWALVEGTAGMEALDADWHGDTLYVAVHRPDVPTAPSAVLAITVDNGNPVVSGVGAIEDPAIAVHRVTASGEGVAWAATLSSPDGTLDAVFGRMAAFPDPMETAEWGQEWIMETVSAADRPGRAVLWTGDVVQCAARTETEGAGGLGALVQTRFGPTGAWFGQYVFGGEGDEEVRDMALDPEGRLLVVGSSNSWTALTVGNDSQDAVLFRSSRTNFVPGFDSVSVEVTIPSEAVFVGVEPLMGPARTTGGWMLRAGSVWPTELRAPWRLLQADGRQVAAGTGLGRVPDVQGAFWWCAASETGRRAVPLWISD